MCNVSNEVLSWYQYHFKATWIGNGLVIFLNDTLQCFFFVFVAPFFFKTRGQQHLNP